MVGSNSNSLAVSYKVSCFLRARKLLGPGCAGRKPYPVCPAGVFCVSCVRRSKRISSNACPSSAADSLPVPTLPT